MHSDIDTLERIEIIRDLRLGAFDVLVGINLLREGLDIPECGFVAILDADKEGFLRSETSLVQTIGRAARITPESVKARISDILDSVYERDHVRADISGTSGKGFADGGHLVGNNLQTHLNALEKEMRDAAADLDFEKAARLRDEIKRLKAAELATMDDPMARQEARATESGGGSRKASTAPISPLEGGGRAARAGGGDPAAANHPTPDLRSDPPPQGEGVPRLSTSGRNKSGAPQGRGSSLSPENPEATSYFRKNTLDEMTVGRTEKPVTGKLPEKPKPDAGGKPISPLEGEMSGRTEGGTPTSRATDDPRPIIRARSGAGSYEDPADGKRKARTKGKTGRPGR